MGNEHPKLVEVGRISIHYTQFTDPFVELECSFEWVFQGFVFLKESCIFCQPRLDLIIEEKLGKYGEFFPQKLVAKVNGGIHDTRSVCSDRIGNVPDVDGIEVLVLAIGFHENLVIQVVQVIGHKDVNVSHDFQDIQALF